MEILKEKNSTALGALVSQKITSTIKRDVK